LPSLSDRVRPGEAWPTNPARLTLTPLLHGSQWLSIELHVEEL